MYPENNQSSMCVFITGFNRTINQSWVYSLQALTPATSRPRAPNGQMPESLRATWTAPRKELLMSRQLKDAEETPRKAGVARGAAVEHLQQAQAQARAAEERERDVENRVTELRVELEAAQCRSVMDVERSTNEAADRISADCSYKVLTNTSDGVPHVGTLEPAVPAGTSADDSKTLQEILVILNCRPALWAGLRAADAASSNSNPTTAPCAQLDIDNKRRKTDQPDHMPQA